MKFEEIDTVLESSCFNKFIAIVGIIGNTLELAPPAGLYPEIWGKIDTILIGVVGIFLIICYVFIFGKLLKLSKDLISISHENV